MVGGDCLRAGLAGDTGTLHSVARWLGEWLKISVMIPGGVGQVTTFFCERGQGNGLREGRGGQRIPGRHPGFFAGVKGVAMREPFGNGKTEGRLSAFSFGPESRLVPFDFLYKANFMPVSFFSAIVQCLFFLVFYFSMLSFVSFRGLTEGLLVVAGYNWICMTCFDSTCWVCSDHF